MDAQKYWTRFIKSGSAAEYLKYVNSIKENEISGGSAVEIHNRGTYNKGNISGGE